MNGPGTRSAPGPASIRPNSTVPNTTSSRPASTASTRAHARWNTVAGGHPSARARSRTRPASPASTASRARCGAAAVAVHVQQPERGGRLGHIAQQAGEVPLVLLPRHAQPGLRHEVPERQRLGQPVRLARHSSAAISPSTTSSAGVVQHQVMDLQQRQPPAASPGSAATCTRSSGAGPRSIRGPAAASSPAAGSAPAGRGVTSVTGSTRLPPHHLHRLGQPLPGHRRSGRCRAGPPPAAARPGTPSSRARESNPQHERLQVHVRRLVRRPSGGGRTCPPAAAPAGRRRPRSPPRRPPARRSGRSAPAVSSTSGSMSGVISARPGRDQVRRHRHLGRPGRRRPARPGSASRTAPAPAPARPALAQPLDQPHRQQRMPAQREEVILGPDPVHAQHLGEQPAQDLLRAPCAGPGRRAPRRVVRGGQRRPVQLPVRRQRQRVQHHHRRRAPCTPAAAPPRTPAPPRPARRRSPSPPARRGRRSRPAACRPGCPPGRSPPPGPRPGRRPAPPRPRRARSGTRGSSPAHRPARRTPAAPPRRPPGQVPGPVHPLPAPPNGHATNRSAGQPRPAQRTRGPARAPATYSSPATPAGTGPQPPVQHEHPRSPRSPGPIGCRPAPARPRQHPAPGR